MENRMQEARGVPSIQVRLKPIPRRVQPHRLYRFALLLPPHPPSCGPRWAAI